MKLLPDWNSTAKEQTGVVRRFGFTSAIWIGSIIGAIASVSAVINCGTSPWIPGEVIISVKSYVTDTDVREYARDHGMMVKKTYFSEMTAAWTTAADDNASGYVAPLVADSLIFSVIVEDSTRLFLQVDVRADEAYLKALFSKFPNLTLQHIYPTQNLVTLGAPVGWENYWVGRLQHEPWVISAERNQRAIWKGIP